MLLGYMICILFGNGKRRMRPKFQTCLLICTCNLFPVQLQTETLSKQGSVLMLWSTFISIQPMIS